MTAHGKKVIARMFAMGMLVAFLPQVLWLYARHHWTGLEKALDQQGSLESCHCLFSRTTKRFLNSFGASAPKRTLQQPLRSLLDVVDGTALPVKDADDGAHAAGADADVHDPQAAEKLDDQEWAKVNSARRTVMREFWQARPLWLLIVFRMAFEPIRVLLAWKFKTGSWAWEAKQRSKLAKARNTNGDIAQGREYRALLAATNVYENEAMTSIQRLYDDTDTWTTRLAPEPQAMTVRGRALGFRIVARIGAGLEQNLIHRHKQYPFTTLRLYREPHLAAQVFEDATDTVCVGGYVDPWTKSVVAEHADASGLVSPLFLAVLILVVLTVWVCTGLIESLHATTRRLIFQASVHTHQARFDDVNAAWVRGAARRMQQRCLMLRGRSTSERPAATDMAIEPRRGRKRKAKCMSDGRPMPKPKRKPFHNPGGPWRCFVRQRLWGCKQRQAFKHTMETLSAEYRNLSRADKATYREGG